MLQHRINPNDLNPAQADLGPAYASRALGSPVPRYELPEQSMPADLARQIIDDELQLDGNPALNLASFVTTWMEPEARDLFLETLGKNSIDADEYPQTQEIHNRCVNILAHLFHAPSGEGVGCATVGSSEAIHLCGLALKWRWRARMESAGKDTSRPNIVMGHNVQVCWEKFARYFDVEPRYVPLTEGRYVIGVQEALDMVDENTIAVVGILGSTYTGEYEPIADLAAGLDDLAARTHIDVPLHVDAASGGFVAPFLSPDLLFDFRLERVHSINVSGHKYGLVYPGVGWAIWRQRSYLPEALIFHVNYPGGDQPTFNLNFSRGGSQILAQYYNFLRLGRQGYQGVMRQLASIRDHLADQLSNEAGFTVLGRSGELPVVCWTVRPDEGYDAFDLSDRLRARGWIVPAYRLAPDAEHISLLRVVVREGLSFDMAELLLADISRAVVELRHSRPPANSPTGKTRGVC